MMLRNKKILLVGQKKVVNKDKILRQNKIPRTLHKMKGPGMLFKERSRMLEGKIISEDWRQVIAEKFFRTLRIHRWKDFRKINMDIYKSQSSVDRTKLSDAEICAILTQIPRNLTSFKQLRLEIGSYRLGDKTLESIAYNIIRNYPELRRLSIKLPTCFDATIYGVKILGSEIGKNMKHLEHLTLKLKYLEKMNDQGLKLLAREIGRYLNNLRQLHISFNSCWSISDKGLALFGSGFSNKLKKLEELSLSFKASRTISSFGFTVLLAEIATNMESLKHLELKFSKCFFMDDLALELFGTVIKGNLKSLNSLSLKFTICDITAEGVEELIASIGSYLPGVQHLSLTFNQCEINHEEIENIAVSIGQHLGRLQSLNLNLMECKRITMKEIEILVSEIRDNLKNLKKLTMIFANGRLKDDEDVERLEKQLEFIKECDICVWNRPDSDTYAEDFNEFDDSDGSGFVFPFRRSQETSEGGFEDDDIEEGSATESGET